ncbi:hypothetical protein COR50_01220 [Chitinophaga caeni]|uniref:PKD-like family protein n=1 Tax=Chitinophaga caeni TaxID=2029983 RepID=A0A291QPM9_9BACT|nr:PKD-like family lipoprotein [Chitinophaga caeni]ATL45891.1 hypothetical protein COR50_01220 [Chitinophaga caeni]
MKKSILYILGIGLLYLTSCYKDKGNYDYVDVPPPVVTNLDTLYNVNAGDSLIIAPKVALAAGNDDYICEWKFYIPGDTGALEYEMKELRIVFGLGANRYPGLLRITDQNTGMKYFYNFTVVGKTEFTQGTLVFSDNGDHSTLSFIKPDGTVQAGIFEAINRKQLAGGASQLLHLQNRNYMNVLTAYWLISKDDPDGGVQIDANTLQELKTLRAHFYEPPATINVGQMYSHPFGTINGIINDQLYIGSQETAPFATYYGYFGAQVNGKYAMHQSYVHNIAENPYGGYYLAFEKDKHYFMRFTNNTFMDTTYELGPTKLDSAFNPKDLGMDLIHMTRFSDEEIYALCDSSGLLKELKFSVEFNNGGTVFHASSMRDFVKPELISAATLWATSPIGVIYFSSNDKVYRYNPLNEEVVALTTDFNGKAVSLLKVQDNGNLLIVGVEGSIYYLDISVGHQGDMKDKIDGIPGQPKDIFVRLN